MKKGFLVISILVFTIVLSFAFSNSAMAALETPLTAGAKAITTTVPYRQTQWFQLAVVNGTGYNITLTSYLGNSDLFVFDNNFNLIGSSVNLGKTQDIVWYQQAQAGVIHIACYGATSSTNQFTIQAAIKNIPLPTTYTCTVNYNAAQGSVTKSPNQTTYALGTQVTLTAAPKTGCLFNSWSGSWAGTGNPITITMDSNKTITANFSVYQPAAYTLTVNSVNGTVTKNPSQATYTSGTQVTLTAAPISGYQFSYWSGDSAETVNSVVITMDSNKNITANFIPAFDYSTVTWRHDSQRTAVYPNGPTVFPLTQKWSYVSSDSINVSYAPVIVNNTIYLIGSRNVTGLSTVSAIDATTQLQKWSSTGYAFTTPPCVSGTSLYIGGWMQNNDTHQVVQDLLYAFDVNTGKLLWIYNVGVFNGSITSPVVANNVVYFTLGENLFAVNAGDGSLRWKYTASTAGMTTYCSLANGVVYFGDFAGKIYALDADTGVVKWTYAISENKYLSSTICISNGTLFFGSYGYGTWTAALYALSADTGVLKWKTPSNYIDVSIEGVCDGVVYADTNSGGWRLAAFNANTGSEIWYSDVHTNSLTISNGFGFMNDINTLNVINMATGKLRSSIISMPTSFGEPIVYNGKVYIIIGNKLYCYGS